MWMASRALIVAGHSQDLTGMGSSWNIKMPVVIPMEHSIWAAVQDGNTFRVQRELALGLAPSIMDEDGWGLLHVSKRSDAYG